ncbi:MAG: hypothetical protein GY873_12910 [Bosea sp.]|nr:hypothetical protein [Bosea sp. (in: a-proteobacteria)]
MEFANEVCNRLGQAPTLLASKRIAASDEPLTIAPMGPPPTADKKILGVDVFVHAAHRDANKAGADLSACNGGGLSLEMITNRGVKVWPNGLPQTFCTDHWRCRFRADSGETTHEEIVALLGRVAAAGIDFIKTEHLCSFDGVPGFSLGQGQ